MSKLLTVAEAMEEYGLSRKKTEELFNIVGTLPRVPRGKKYVLRKAFEEMTGGMK